MSAAEAVVSLVRSSEFVRMLADAPSTTVPKVYRLIGDKGEAALISYIPALGVAKDACKAIGDKCIGEYLRFRDKVIREVCETLGVDWIIRKILEILRKIPAWVRGLLKDAADVWKILEEWSNGEFRLGQFTKLFGMIVFKYGPKIAAMAKAVASAAVKAGKAIYDGALWLVSDAPDVMTNLVKSGVTAFAELAEWPADILVKALRDAGFGAAADALGKVVGWLTDAVKSAGGTAAEIVKCATVPWKCI